MKKIFLNPCCFFGFHISAIDITSSAAICNNCRKKVQYITKGQSILYHGKPAEPVKNPPTHWGTPMA
jgi:hypothetical protein